MITRRKKLKKWFCFSLILLLIIPLSGCWDANDPDRMIYAQGMGVDYKNGKYKLYVQLINLSLLAKSESGAGSEKTIISQIGQTSGDSVEDALFNLYKHSQRQIHWGHLTYIFFTSKALKQNSLQQVTDLVDRYFQTHYHMWVYNSDSPLSKIMDTNPPFNMSTYLSRLSDPDASFEQNSFIQALDVREILISHYEPPHEIIIPVVRSNKDIWTGDGKPKSVGDIKGIAIMKGSSLKGRIVNNDVNGYRWMEKKFKRVGLSLHTQNKTTIGLTITKRKVKIRPIIRNGRVQFDIRIKTNGTINNLENNIPVSKISSTTKKLIKKEVLNTYLKGLEMDADVYRLSNILYEKEFPIWKKIQRDGKIPLDKDSIRIIDVIVKVMDGGKQRKVPTLK